MGATARLSNPRREASGAAFVTRGRRFAENHSRRGGEGIVAIE
jgi:hypothetical protein